MQANPWMRSECFAGLQASGLLAGKPSDHPDRKGVIAAAPATGLAPRGPRPFWEAHQYPHTTIPSSAEVTVDIEFDGVRPVQSDAALTLKPHPTAHNRHRKRLDPG